MLSWGYLVQECEYDDNPYGGKLGEYLSTLKLLEKLIDVGKWVLVLNCLLVQWMVVDAESVCPILLMDKKNTTTPWR